MACIPPYRGDTSQMLLFKIASCLSGGDESGPVQSFNGRGGVVTLTSGDVTGALGFTPISQADGDARYVLKAGDTMTGKLQFSGTTHVGLRLNNLTTAQRDAIAAPTAGDLIWNTTTTQVDRYDGSSWGAAGTGLYVLKAGDTMTGPLNMTAGQSYQYNSVNVIRAQTALVNYYFASSGNLVAVGTNNIAVGVDALLNLSSGSSNTAVGVSALKANTTGGDNVAIGMDALILNSTGTNNTAVGRSSLSTNSTGSQLTAFGYGALFSNNSGSLNGAIGFQALFSNTSGSSNTANGYVSLFSNTTGSFNTASGVQALFANIIGSSNTSSGYRSLFNSTGDNNTGIGRTALVNLTTGTQNTALGYNTGLGITTGSNNTIIGANVTGLAAALSNNIIIADGAGNQRINVDSSGNTTLAANLNIPSGSAYQYNSVNVIRAQTALSNYFFGPSGNLTMAGDFNTASGGLAFTSNTSGARNVATGYAALNANTTGSFSVAIGYFSLAANTTGERHVSVGYQALLSNTTGSFNVAVGYQALRLNTTGDSNMAVGYQALAANTTGFFNSAIGVSTLTANVGGNSNTAIGYNSLPANTSGVSNTAIGVNSLQNVTTGSLNTAIGYGTGLGITTGSNNTIIGASVTGLAAGLTNNVIIADGSGNQRITVDSSGTVGINNGTVAASTPMLSLGQTWNNGAVTFTGLLASYTITAAATDSKLFNFQTDGIDRFWFATIGQLFMTRQDATNSGVNFFQRKRGSTGGATNAVLGDATIGTLSHSAWDGTAYATGSRISGVADENWSNTAHGSRMDFYTTPSGTTAEQIVIRLNNVGQALYLNGLPATPSVSFQSDQNTGIYRVGTDHLGVAANGAIVLGVGAAKLGFFATVAATPVVQQVSGANLTNNVTAGGTDDTIANYTDLTTYANDAAAIRNDIYQLARKLKQVNDALRAYGLLT